MNSDSPEIRPDDQENTEDIQKEISAEKQTQATQPQKKKPNWVLITVLFAFVVALIFCAVIYALFGGSTSASGENVIELPTSTKDEQTGYIEPATAPDYENSLLSAPDHKPTVILDAGHGFGDVGCAGPDTALGMWEKDMTVDMVNSLKTELEALGAVVMTTHDGETFYSCEKIADMCAGTGVSYDSSKESWEENDIFSPYERAIYMNVLDRRYGADYALSIHVNSIEDDKRSGFDIDYCAENCSSEKSAAAAQALKTALSAAYPGRDIHFFADSWNDSFIVTKFSLMPSALLEIGYYTNEDDVKLLTDPEWRSSLSKELAKAIYNYIIA